MGNQHCDDHCDLLVKLTQIDDNVTFIKDNIKNKKSDIKWAAICLISFSALITSIYGILK